MRVHAIIYLSVNVVLAFIKCSTLSLRIPAAISQIDKGVSSGATRMHDQHHVLQAAAQPVAGGFLWVQ